MHAINRRKPNSERPLKIRCLLSEDPKASKKARYPLLLCAGPTLRNFKDSPNAAQDFPADCPPDSEQRNLMADARDLQPSL